MEIFSCGRRRAVAARKIMGSNPIPRFNNDGAEKMKGKIKGIGNTENTVHLTLRLDKDVLRNLEKVCADLKIPDFDEITYKYISKDPGNLIPDYNAKKKTDEKIFVENQKYKLYVIIGLNCVHVIAIISKKNRDAFMKPFHKYFEVAKSKK